MFINDYQTSDACAARYRAYDIHGNPVGVHEEQLPAIVDQRAANLAFAAHVQLIRMYADDTDVLTLARTAERAALDMIRSR